MLIAALTAYLLIHFGSHSAALTNQWDQTTTLIKQHVADEARQKEALAIVANMKAAATALTKQREKSVGTLDKLLAKREVPVSDIQQAAQPLVTQDRATAEKLLDLRFQLKSLLTASEWALVFPAPAKGPDGAKKTSRLNATVDVRFDLSAPRRTPRAVS
jgi:hypothetical protein